MGQRTLLARRCNAGYCRFEAKGDSRYAMMTPFEQRVKHCIESYQRLRMVHDELNAAAREFKCAHWTPAFDHNGGFVGMLLAENGREILASESRVKIGSKEWR